MEQRSDPGRIYAETVDKHGEPITIFSTTGELKSDEDFAKALDHYDSGKGSPAGFVTLKSGSIQGNIRQGFENTIGNFARNTLPAIGGDIGQLAANSVPLVGLLEKMGVISPGRMQAITERGNAVGEAGGRFIGRQIDTLPEAAGTIGMTAAGMGAGPVVNAAGNVIKSALLGNAVKTGIGGLIGTTAGKIAGGEDLSIGDAAVEFTTAALGGGVQGVTSAFLTKYLTKGTGEKVAQEIVETFTKRYPELKNNPQFLDIATSSPAQLSNLTSMMSKALRGNNDVAVKDVINALNAGLPHTMSPGQQNTIRAQVRALITAQNEQLDKIGNEGAYKAAGDVVKEKTAELLAKVKDFYPKVKNADALLDRAKMRLIEQTRQYREGAEVLYYLKEAGADSKFDPMKFAQLIRGNYTTTPGSQLNEVGKILGQGQSLKELPLPQQAPSINDLGTGAVNFIKNRFGIGRMLPNMRTPAPPVPWKAQGDVIPPLLRPVVQNTGSGAMRDFMREER